MKKWLSIMSRHARVSLLLSLCVGLLFCLSACGTTAKRSIVAESLNGTVTESEGKESYPVTKGEKLTAGREVYVSMNSDLTMLIDSDKHIYAGEDTGFILTATGGKGSTETKFELKRGKLTSSIDNKLGDGESFEVETPNASMAVRGTVFTVNVKQASGGYVTDVSVEKGSVEVATEENGVIRTVLLTAGESDTYNGKAPKGKKEDKAPVTSTSKKDGGDGPLVQAIFKDENGQDIYEYFHFSEDHEYFKEDMGKWRLELSGQTINLKKNWEINSELTVAHGTVVTSENAYIVNNKVLLWGDDYSGDDNITLKSSGMGILNKGTLHLRSGVIEASSGTVIKNENIMRPETWEDDPTRFESGFEEEVSLKGGATFLVNEGKAIIIDKHKITGESGNYIVNSGELMLDALDLTGQADAMILNGKTGTLVMGGTRFFVENEGTFGLLNEGRILGAYDSHMFEDYYVSLSAQQPVYIVSAGTGLVNRGTIDAQAKYRINGGLGVDNYGSIGMESYYSTIIELEDGTGLKNEEGASFARGQFMVKQGQAVVNFGTLGTEGGYEEFYSLDEQYTGTLVLNEKSGKTKGSIQLLAVGLDNAKLFENLGVCESNYVDAYAGLKIHESYNLFEAADDWTYAVFDVRLTMAPDQDAKIKDSVLFDDYGELAVKDGLRIAMFGIGEGDVTGYHAHTSGKHETNQVSEFIFGSNITGAVIDQGIKFKGSFAIQIGKYIWENGGSEGLYRVINEYEYDQEKCFGNIGLKNSGETEGNYSHAYLYGLRSTGVLNEGFFSGTMEIDVRGIQNIGMDNPGTYGDGNGLNCHLNERGGNTCVRNSGIIKNTGISLWGGSRNYSSEEYMVLREAPETEYGPDTVLINTSTGTIDCENKDLSIMADAKDMTGLYNYNYLKVGQFQVHNLDGTGAVLAEESYTRAGRLWIMTHDNVDMSYTGTGIFIHSLFEVIGSSDKSDGGTELNGMIDIAMWDEDFGVMIMSEGSLVQSIYYENDYISGKCSIRGSSNGGCCITNYGHLHLEYPRFIRSDGPKSYAHCLSDHGVFSYSKYPDRVKNGYGTDGCPGPWYGAEY